jgi:hypothetical protein
MSRNTLFTRIAAAVSVPWHAFVAAFLYYTVLAAVLLGGGRVGAPMVTTAYLAPALAYLVTLAVRFAQRGLAFARDAAPMLARAGR